MTVKELIVSLLDCDLNKQVSPTEKWWLIVGNYCRYNNTIDFNIFEYDHDITIGVENDN